MEGRAGRLVVCPTPIGNLEDVTLRVLRALARGGRGRLRGHPPHAQAARPPRDRGADGQLPRAQRAPPGARAGGARRRRRGAVALVSDAGTPGVSDPGLRAGARVPRARAARWRCCPARRRSSRRWSRRGCRPSGWRFAGFLPRKEGELRAELERGDETLVAFESPRAGRPIAGGARRRRPRARGGGVPGADEGARGGRAGNRARGRGTVRRGSARRDRAGDRSVRAGRAPTSPRALEAVEALVAAGARRRAAAKVVCGLTGVPANRLYRTEVRIAAVDLDRYRRRNELTWARMAAGWEQELRWMWNVTRPVGEGLVALLDPEPGQTILELAAGTGETGFAAAAQLGDGGKLITSDSRLRAGQRGTAPGGAARARQRRVPRNGRGAHGPGRRLRRRRLVPVGLSAVARSRHRARADPPRAARGRALELLRVGRS